MKYTEHVNPHYDLRGEYEMECPTCHKIHRVFTQWDYDPEYRTEVNVVCDCGDLVTFDLPVN